MARLPGVTELLRPTILFDFDGTLANTVPLILASYRHTIDTVGLPPADEATIRSWIGRTLPDMFTELAGPDRVAELTEIYSTWQHDNAEQHLLPYAGMRQLVTDLIEAGAKVGIATSRRRGSAQRLKELLGLDEWLPLLVGLEDSTEHKPAAEPLLLAAERLGSEPGDCVYVGDALVDLRAAQAAGMVGIGVTWGAGVPDELRAESAHAVVDEVADLRRVLLG
ncbi:HAD family hydrolase [Parenemella sanctibonifatiensis]|uniref:HAD family hydrolase n=1 Tax=Parenemella sanctibonifatiensis TaxID=2016505 RepID=A0A255E9D5_9ACTN|nr:HAD family hydrolase [Parenemella sanctibonifatiensis]